MTAPKRRSARGRPAPRKSKASARSATSSSSADRKSRLVFRGDGKASSKRELDRLASSIKTGWRLVVAGYGANMSSSSRTDWLVGVTPDRRVWVLSVSDWGDDDEERTAPDTQAAAAFVDPETVDENLIVQKLLDASADWFSIDEVIREGEFEVRLPGFAD